MVGVSAGLRHYIDCFIHGEAFILQETDQLRDNHGWMGIIDLDSHMLI